MTSETSQQLMTLPYWGNDDGSFKKLEMTHEKDVLCWTGIPVALGTSHPHRSSGNAGSSLTGSDPSSPKICPLTKEIEESKSVKEINILMVIFGQSCVHCGIHGLLLLHLTAVNRKSRYITAQRDSYQSSSSS
jgi:hypothetical protein